MAANPWRGLRERRGSTVLAAGDLILAHTVFDGVGYQFIGGPPGAARFDTARLRKMLGLPAP